jgi:2-oxoglutarate dehydrogenase E1 component
MERKAQVECNDSAFIRIEQLYPFPDKKIDRIISKYKNADKYFWVQEEPENMGAWTFIMKKMRELNLQYIGRKEKASPATGYAKSHHAQSEEIFHQVFVGIESSEDIKNKKQKAVK